MRDQAEEAKAGIVQWVKWKEGEEKRYYTVRVTLGFQTNLRQSYCYYPFEHTGKLNLRHIHVFN